MPFTLPSGPFALLRREGRAEIEILTGTVEVVPHLADIPLDPGPAGPGTLALVPYRQVAERGFDAIDDDTPLECLRVTAVTTAVLADVLAALPAAVPPLRDGAFDRSDDAYADIVDTVLRDEIGRGEGSNFVIHRVYRARVTGDPVVTALAAFGQLLRHERGAYWTFCVHTGARTVVGATPERHVSVDDGLVMMNPISGTYRHPAGGPDRAGLLRFLADEKETEELYMVLDEELKMMATVAEAGGQVVGPYLKPMAHLHHTEYLLAGRSSLDVRAVLRETMFAPTVVGSPIENACRVVARHERRGRRYYGAVLALLGHDEAGRQTLDAPILIRTAEIDASGHLRVPVGATLVRHSTPAGEVAETYAKAAGILSSLGLGRPAPGATVDADDPVTDPAVVAALQARNRYLARFWLDQRADSVDPALDGLRVLIVDAEDTFTGMLTHQLRALGVRVDRRDHRDPDLPVIGAGAGAGAGDGDGDGDGDGSGSGAGGGFDLVVFGPGPGDPTSATDPKMVRLRSLIRDRLAAGLPLLGICLSHQLIAGLLGLTLLGRDAPYQGTQREIDFFGRPERVGFYSTFTALAPGRVLDTAAGPVEVSLDPVTGEVHALRGAAFASVQFHLESVLSQHGVDLLRDLLTGVLSGAAGRSTKIVG